MRVQKIRLGVLTRFLLNHQRISQRAVWTPSRSNWTHRVQLLLAGSVPEFLRKPIATCDFPGRVPDPLPPPPFWIRPWKCCVFDCESLPISNQKRLSNRSRQTSFLIVVCLVCECSLFILIPKVQKPKHNNLNQMLF